MSVIYFLVFKIFYPTYGTFEPGRIVDLFQMDTVIVILLLILQCERAWLRRSKG